MHFLETDNGLVNLDLVTRVLIGRPSSPWARTPVTIEMVDGTAVQTAAHQNDLKRLDDLDATIIPAQPGWQRLLWVDAEHPPLWEPVIAWQVRSDRTAEPVCAELLAPSCDWAVVAPSGRVNDVCDDYANVDEWVAEMRERTADREQLAE